MPQLRTHQQLVSAIANAIGQQQTEVRDVLAAVTPGGGKSLLPVIMAAALHKAGRIDRVCWIVPRDSLRFRQECGQWQISLVLLMPDHLHALIRFNPERGIQRTVLDWKRYTAKAARVQWQQDFFEHRVRDEAACQEKWRYILFNPVRAGLVKTPEEWPYVWSNGQWHIPR